MERQAEVFADGAAEGRLGHVKVLRQPVQRPVVGRVGLDQFVEGIAERDFTVGAALARYHPFVLRQAGAADQRQQGCQMMQVVQGAVFAQGIGVAPDFGRGMIEQQPAVVAGLVEAFDGTTVQGAGQDQVQFVQVQAQDQPALVQAVGLQRV